MYFVVVVEAFSMHFGRIFLRKLKKKECSFNSIWPFFYEKAEKKKTSYGFSF